MKTTLHSHFLLSALIISVLTLATATDAVAKYQYSETTIHTFAGPSDGYIPENLIVDQSGNLYGTTLEGGGACVEKIGCGTVFEMSPKSGGGWSEKVIFAFNGTSDGSSPSGNLVMDAAGNIYGTTLTEGLVNGGGVVFELSPSGSGWVETVLYDFTGFADGGYPNGLTFDASGNLYGTAAGGGANGFGAIYKLTNTGSGWTQSVLYSFANSWDGASPSGPLLLDAAGNIYGTTGAGGSTKCDHGCGTVFRLSPTSTGWQFSRLYAFQGPGGQNPGGLHFDSAGNLYGVAAGGRGYGVVFELSPTSSGQWKETLLHDFTNGTDGANPSSISFDASGTLYGATNGVESTDANTIFRLKPAASGWVFSTIFVAAGRDTGIGLRAPTVFDGSGNLFGVASDGLSTGAGSVYELSPPAMN